MADSTYKTLLKNKLRALFGAGEDSSGSLKTAVSQLSTKRISHHFPTRTGGAITNNLLRFAHTASKSLSQPIDERVIYHADREGVVVSAWFSSAVAPNQSVSASKSWTLLLNKRGAGHGTNSQTYSVTFAIGGLTSCTKRDGDTTISVSVFKNTLAHSANRIAITGGSTKVRLKAGDVLTARVRKGRVTHADDTGIHFPGGQLVVNIEDD